MSAATRKAAPARPRPAAPADGLALLDRAASGAFPATLYVMGADEAKKAAFLAEFRRHWAHAVPAAPAARVLLAGEDGIDDVLSAFQNVSMFTPRELTLLLEVEDYARSEKRVEALATGIRNPGGESCLVIVETAEDSPRKKLDPLRAACQAVWVATPLDSRELLAWSRRRLAAARITPETGALEALVETCEGESVSFFNELGKLEGWCAAAGRLTKQDVEDLSRRVIVGAELTDYLAAVAGGDAALAAKRLGRILAEGESEGSVLWALGNLVGGAMGGWARHRELSALLGRRRGVRELTRSLDAVYRAEAAWKTGRADVLSALEYATREVAAN